MGLVECLFAAIDQLMHHLQGQPENLSEAGRQAQ
jgi:hypothetical protein